MYFASLYTELPLCPSIACQYLWYWQSEPVLSASLTHCIHMLLCMHLHLPHFHLHQSHLSFICSHLLLLGCYIYFTPSSDLQHTLLSLAISLRSAILLASQPLFVALGSFWYPYLLLRICFFLVYLDFHFSSFKPFLLHHHPSLRISLAAWDILSLCSILHLSCITISIDIVTGIALGCGLGYLPYCITCPTLPISLLHRSVFTSLSSCISII